MGCNVKYAFKPAQESHRYMLFAVSSALVWFCYDFGSDQLIETQEHLQFYAKVCRAKCVRTQQKEMFFFVCHIHQ